MTVPKSHPRYVSLSTRDLVVDGVKKGITAPDGLIAHGRGEAFDYFIGEKTTQTAKHAIKAAARLLASATYPVISINGNAAALVTKELITLSKILSAPMEVNVFHTSLQREKKIKQHLLKNGAKNVLLPQKNTRLKYIDSNRKYINKEGIAKADVVFVPLEDGDRTEALIKSGKKVITIDLNPQSRTAETATISIVDNIVRTMPLLITEVRRVRNKKNPTKIAFSNKEHLRASLHIMRGNV